MRVRRSPYLYVERKEGEELHVREGLAGNRAVVSAKTFELLRRLESPVEVAPAPEVSRMLDLGFLIEEGHEARAAEAKLFARVAPAMFGCPPWRLGERADFVFLGVPLDVGNLTAPGARYGPDALRKASALYPPRFDAARGTPAGWFDYDTSAELLGGARLADAGEVFLTPGAGSEESGRKISAAAHAVVESGGCPVVVGGDHSITFAALRGVLRGPCGLLHLDAHADSASHLPGLPHHYGNVVSRIVRELGVAQVVHAGVRGLGHGSIDHPPRRRAVSASWLRAHSASELVALLDPGLEWYVSVDIDVVDPSEAPATATPSPGGLTVAQTRTLLRAVGELRQVAGCDLVEVNPQFDHNGVTGAVACELLLALLGAIWRGSR
jgi:agmatinase